MQIFLCFFGVFLHFKRFCIIFRPPLARSLSFAHIVSFCPLSPFLYSRSPATTHAHKRKTAPNERFFVKLLKWCFARYYCALISLCSDNYKYLIRGNAYAEPMQYLCNTCVPSKCLSF